MGTCQVCGNKMGDFDICTHEPRAGSGIGPSLAAPFDSKGDFEDANSDYFGKKSVMPLLLGPLGAVVLDIIFPIWTTLWVALGFLLVATISVNASWTQIGTGIPFSFTGFVKTMPRVLFTPSLIRLYSSGHKYKRHTITWFGSLLLSALAVLCVGTPGNGNGLEKTLQSGIKLKTGQTLGVDCPTVFVTTPGATTTCYVKLILGLKVPVHVKVLNVLGEITWTARLN